MPQLAVDPRARAPHRPDDLLQGLEVVVLDPDEPPRDPRLPPVGTVIHREHDGVVHEIRVLKDGFEYQGRHYTSLSTIAREVTGTSWNGFLWAGLTQRKKRSRAAGGEG